MAVNVSVTGIVAAEAEAHPLERRTSSNRDPDEFVTVPFRLSMEPPSEWVEALQKRSQDELSNRDVRISGDKVSLVVPVSRLPHLAIDLASLKRAVDAANNDYGRFLSSELNEQRRKDSIRAKVKEVGDSLSFD